MYLSCSRNGDGFLFHDRSGTDALLGAVDVSNQPNFNTNRLLDLR